MRGSRKFCQGGSNFLKKETFFLVDEGRKDQNITKSGPSSARQPNAIYDGPKVGECWLGSFVIFQGIRNSTERNPICL